MLFLNSQEMSAFSVSKHSELLSILEFGMLLPKGGSAESGGEGVLPEVGQGS